MRGWTHAAFPIDDASRVGEARRHAAMVSSGLGWTEVEAGRLALVVTELGTNLHKHALHGQLLIAARPATSDVEVISIDEGPGIGNLGLAMQDGHSSGGSPGTGLGAVKRLANDFDMHSSVPEGTVCVARVRAKDAPRNAGAFEVGAICVPVRGETECGDAWGVFIDGPRATLIAADGLGHGPQAAKASNAAIEAFAADPRRDLRGLVEEAHVALQTTRGAAVCVLRVDGADETVRCTGAGNVAVRVVSGVFDRSMATQHGTAGLQIRRPEETSMQLPLHGVVLVHTDGIETRWSAQTLLPVLGRDPALAAALLLRHHSRKRDDATVVVLRRKEHA
jgi:anti-sigma regulatory factor (Ser/Thr protein kinase)